MIPQQWCNYAASAIQQNRNTNVLCSIPCYKSHKTTHENDTPPSSTASGSQQIKVDRPGTTQRVPKVDFTGFEKDKDFQQLLKRFPNLKHQLQLACGLTLEPGPDDSTRWNKQNWYPDDHGNTRGGLQDRGHGRGRGRGGGSGGGRGGLLFTEVPPEERLRLPWNREKGDKQATEIIGSMRKSANEEHAEGMGEFVQLCQMKFGK
ncbi:Hypothetical predicted protein [Lecanosticta acicola]|uniref:Uncharacterized protein n=1 Tax=Lecanosticta acicola TaxID=111012 RepID=A0AAI8Z173_9PEZI|nr:Hypothetical predicted protein [Lecanosticta acicola]